MPNTNTITIQNGSADLTFQPSEVQSDTAIFREDDVAKPLVDRAALMVDQVKNKNLVKRNVRINVPFVDSEGVRTYENANFAYTGLNTGTYAQRELALDILIGALQDTEIRKVLLNPEWFW